MYIMLLNYQAKYEFDRAILTCIKKQKEVYATEGRAGLNYRKAPLFKKSPKLLIQQIRNRCYKTLGTGVINSLTLPPSLSFSIYSIHLSIEYLKIRVKKLVNLSYKKLFFSPN